MLRGWVGAAGDMVGIFLLTATRAFIAGIKVPTEAPFTYATHANAVLGQPTLDARREITHHHFVCGPVDFVEGWCVEPIASGPVFQKGREGHQLHDCGRVDAGLFDAVNEEGSWLGEEAAV